MSDQARTLRLIAGGRSATASERPRLRGTRAVAVTGGKGGVGKSTIALNLAVAFAELGSRTVLVDGDLGMADLNLLMGVAPDRSALDLFDGCSVSEVLTTAHGISLLPGLNGSHRLESLSESAREFLLRAVAQLRRDYPSMVVDVGAGVGPTPTSFGAATDAALVVATAEPLSMADAYASLKVLSLERKLRKAYVVPNAVRSKDEADEVVGRLIALVGRFLDMELVALPSIPHDPNVTPAAERGVPLLKLNPDSPASRAIRLLAKRIDLLVGSGMRMQEPRAV